MSIDIDYSVAARKWHAAARQNDAGIPATQIFMFCAAGIFVPLAIIGWTWVIPPDWKRLLPEFAVVPLSMAPALYWHAGRFTDRRDAALTLPWIVLLVLIMPGAGPVFGRPALPMQDAALVRIDHALGFDVPAIMVWTSGHPVIEAVLNGSYGLLEWLLVAAAFLPPLLWQRRAAQRFLVSNTVAFLIGLPLFTLFPAVGPWVGYGFPPHSLQRICGDSLLALRAGHHTAISGIVSFPSFHTIWAILCAVALWPFKWLRLPAGILASLVVISTVTTGWHYATDVLAGLVIAAISLLLAERVIANHG